MNSKQLLMAAVAASMSLNAMADISISGAAKVNSNDGDHTMEADLTITGKSGDISVVAQLGLDNSNMVEQLYMKSKVAGIDVKVGEWKHGKGELNISHTHPGSIEVSTSVGGIELLYRDRNGSAGDAVSIKGSIGGVTTYYRATHNKNVIKLSGSIGGVNFKLHNKDWDDGNVDNSITLKTSVQGIDLTYVNTKSDNGTKMDGFIGKNMAGTITDANAFGISTTIAGNKITYKDIMYNGIDFQKLILTRKIASGTTFEATYVDYDDPANPNDSLNLELAVKF